MTAANSPDIALDTPLGRLRIVSVDADTISIHTKHATDNDPIHVDTLPRVTINGVSYSLRVNLKSLRQHNAHKASPNYIAREWTQYGEWVVHTRNGIMLTGIGKTTTGTPAAFRKVWTVLVPFMADWASKPAGLALLAEAGIAARAERRDELRSSIEAKRLELHDLEVELAQNMNLDVIDLIQLRDGLAG